MIVKLDDFTDGYVVVPTFTDLGYGMSRIERGDMTDKEWNRWRRLNSVKDVVRLMSEYKKTKQPISGMSAAIVKFLEEKGIKTCLVYEERP